MSGNDYTVSVDGVTKNVKSFHLTINTDDIPAATKAVITPSRVNVEQGQRVILDGSKSTAAPESEPLVLKWQQVGNLHPVTLFVDDTQKRAEFNAPTGTTGDIVITVRLTVTDSKGATNSTDAEATIKLPKPGGEDPGLPVDDGWYAQPEKKANKDPYTWKTVNMKKNPAWYKVVDNTDTNVAVEFKTKAGADQYTAHFRWLKDHEAPPPPPPPAPPGEEGEADQEGIKKIYKDDTRYTDQQFFLKRDGPNHARVSGKGERKIMPNGTVQITPTSTTSPASARVYIRTTNPKAMDAAAQSKLGFDWVEMKKAGYMLDPFDYKDFEVGAYYKITDSSALDQFTCYGRGGAHPSDDQWPLQCLGVCYKCQIEMDRMEPRGAKEYHHYGGSKGYAWYPIKAKFDLKSEIGSDSIVGKLIGQKMAIYNEMGSNNEVKAVHMELYLDLASANLDKPDFSKQNWRLWGEWIDDGTNWPEKPPNMDYVKECNAEDGQMFTWGGPYTALRCDDNVWELHALSVRHIIAPPSKNLASSEEEEKDEEEEEEQHSKHQQKEAKKAEEALTNIVEEEEEEAPKGEKKSGKKKGGKK